MIKVDLITGFLGSGKTTFLLQYAQYLMDQGLKIGILEYDYGAVNVDMLLLSKLRGDKCELEMLAAACDEDCLKRRFKTKLISMAMSGYDRVIIEPSGVFDMDMFFDDLREEPLENWYEIGSVITIVNAKIHDDFSKADDFILASQAAGAGLILLSRTQFSTAEEIRATKAHIDRAIEGIKCKNFRPAYMEKDWSALTEEDFRKISNAGFHICDYMKTIAGQELEFSSVCFLDVKDDLGSLKKKIEKLFSTNEYGDISRVKGFIIDGGISQQVNATKYEIFTEAIGIGQETLIVIGTNLDEAKIKELIYS